MNAQTRGFGCKTLVIIVLIALVMGALGGGVVGGGVAYYFAQRQPAVSAVVNAPSSPQSPQVVSLKQDTAIVEAVKRVKPAVVTIISTTQRGTSRLRQGQSTGTGIIIDPKGYIVTNNHVVEGAQKIEALFENGEKSEAKLIGADPFSDLAVVQVTGRSMPAVATLGDSTALQVGEPVIAIGSALGDFRNTVTVGVVSALNRRLGANEGSALEGLIQTDAAINSGNSGGPLLNAAGQVVGINTLVVRGSGTGNVAEGLGFAVPVSTVKFVYAQLVEKGRVTRPFLGVTYTMLNPQIAAANDLPLKSGAWIQEITPNSPAARAGLKAGDIVTAIAGIELTEQTPLPSALLRHRVGETVQLTVVRGGQTLTLSIVLAERPTTG